MKIKLPLQYRRRKTRKVFVNNLGIGGDFPIRIQSMITSFTRDSTACLKEIQALSEVGCELVRITVPNRRDLDSIPEIRRLMKEEGLEVPLVADIHFAPHLAVDSCELFEKIRINPGNFSDRPKNSRTSIDKEYDLVEGKEKMKERLLPLIDNLKKYNRALRVGVNHGSLSTRMIGAYGDSPRGMVESALEVIHLLEADEFYNIIVSLKSSNPFIVQKAYMLLAQSLPSEDSIPFHLGVTESGDAYIGRLKSVCGIGALLAEGIGDTIRVSLTEPSVNEVLFARKFLSSFEQNLSHYQEEQEKKQEKYFCIDLERARVRNTSILVDNQIIGEETNPKLGFCGVLDKAYELMDWDFKALNENGIFLLGNERKKTLLIEDISEKSLVNFDIGKCDALLFPVSTDVFVIRSFYEKKLNQGKPIGLFFDRNPSTETFEPELNLARLIGNGLLDFIVVTGELSGSTLARFFSSMQVTRVKLTETDYIACPSCGRTLFNIQETTQKIKKRTMHLKGVKIGVMGCMVNGPGEMADADFGYVGGGTGKIDLYLGHDRVKKNIKEEDAVEVLISLIKEHGRWVEPTAIP